MPLSHRPILHIVTLLTLGLLSALAPGCSPPGPAGAPRLSPPAPPPQDPIADLLRTEDTVPTGTPLEKMGYSIQVGAFANVDNAVRLERLLDARGLDAYYFRHESGLYKVRFGNHSGYALAHAQAEQLQAQGLINRFFIVSPTDYPAARIVNGDAADLRTELVRTARRFLGTPYRWGGEDAASGFDCSGLTMVSYRLNGLNLPRNSRAQFQSGRRVDRAGLRQGDLVFFATKGGTRVTHVGMYIGDGKFIHAPRPGKTVRVETLSNRFFTRTFMGGRTYL